MGDWCFEQIPNLYGYVQKIYWNAGFIEFLNRPMWIVEFLKGGPTNLFSLYILYRSVSGIGIFHLLTLGVFRKHEMKEDEEYDVFQSDLSIGLVWNYLLTILMVLVGANHEVNTRLVSMSPIYLLGVCDLLFGKRHNFVEKSLAKLVAGWNVATLVWNMVLFPL